MKDGASVFPTFVRGENRETWDNVFVVPAFIAISIGFIWSFQRSADVGERERTEKDHVVEARVVGGMDLAEDVVHMRLVCRQ
jgi:hypothetical protein